MNVICMFLTSEFLGPHFIHLAEIKYEKSIFQNFSKKLLNFAGPVKIFAAAPGNA